MIDKAIDGSIKKYLFKKLMLPQGECKWDDTGGILRNDIPTMIQLLLKIINTATRIGVSNLKDEIKKTTLAKFGNNLKYFHDEIYSN